MEIWGKNPQLTLIDELDSEVTSIELWKNMLAFSTTKNIVHIRDLDKDCKYSSPSSSSVMFKKIKMIFLLLLLPIRNI